MLATQGDLADARTLYDESLAIDRRLVAADPTNAEAQRDLAISLGRIGEILTTQGAVGTARTYYDERLAISRRLAAADPANAVAQRNLAAALWSLAQMGTTGARWADVVAHLEAMQAKGQLLAADAHFLDDARRRAALQRQP